MTIGDVLTFIFLFADYRNAKFGLIGVKFSLTKNKSSNKSRILLFHFILLFLLILLSFFTILVVERNYSDLHLLSKEKSGLLFLLFEESVFVNLKIVVNCIIVDQIFHLEQFYRSRVWALNKWSSDEKLANNLHCTLVIFIFGIFSLIYPILTATSIKPNSNENNNFGQLYLFLASLSIINLTLVYSLPSIRKPINFSLDLEESRAEGIRYHDNLRLINQDSLLLGNFLQEKKQLPEISANLNEQINEILKSKEMELFSQEKIDFNLSAGLLQSNQKLICQGTYLAKTIYTQKQLNKLRIFRHLIREVINESIILQKIAEEIDFDFERQLLLEPSFDENNNFNDDNSPNFSSDGCSFFGENSATGESHIVIMSSFFTELGNLPSNYLHEDHPMMAHHKQEQSYTPMDYINFKIMKANYHKPKEILHSLILHELVHVYDNHVYNQDLTGNLRNNIICELRAYSFEGQCLILNLSYQQKRVWLEKMIDQSCCWDGLLDRTCSKRKEYLELRNALMVDGFIKGDVHIRDLVRKFGKLHLKEYSADSFSI